MVALPAGSTASLIGVKPAAAAAVPSSLPGPGSGTSTPSPLHPRLDYIGSSPLAQHMARPAAASPGAVGAAVAAVFIGAPYKQLLEEFPDVVCPTGELPPVKHGVQHYTETDSQPVAAKYRQLDPVKLAAAQKEFAQLEKQSIVRRSNSCWSSPLHMVQKQDGSWRPFKDYRRLNLQTKLDRYTSPNIGDLTARLAGCTIFSKLDLHKGYHQVPVREQDVGKTAVDTPFGTFEYLRMSFGLRNAGQMFQRLMDSVLAGLPYYFIYMDDVLMASMSPAACGAPEGGFQQVAAAGLGPQHQEVFVWAGGAGLPGAPRLRVRHSAHGSTCGGHCKVSTPHHSCHLQTF
jgi:Reverse transcriptase (RNA-dependent DNA polymerase)